MANKWLQFLSSYRKKHPEKSMKSAMRDGAKVYKSQKGSAEPKAAKKVTRAKKKRQKK